MTEVEKKLQAIQLHFSPETLEALEKRQSHAKSALDRTVEEIKKTSGVESVKNEIKTLQEAFKNLGPRLPKKANLSNRWERTSKALEDLEEALRMLEEHEGNSRCSLCGNTISQEQLHGLVEIKREKKKRIFEDSGKDQKPPFQKLPVCWIRKKILKFPF